MKTWRAITILSFAVSLLAVAFIFTAPFRYPDSIFFWRPILIFLAPLVVVLGLLASRLRSAHAPFSKALIAAAGLFTLLTILGYMGLPILAVAFVALSAMFLSSRALQVPAPSA